MQDLEVDRVTRRFGDFVAVDALSLDVAHGSFFSILGPSGCGKTTLLRLIAGFLSPDEGEVRIGGRSMRGVPPNRRPANMVFQQLALFPMMTVGENVGYGLARRGTPAPEIRDRVERMLARVGLPGAAGKRIDALSGGQKQRVAIARALCMEPKVLLFDEPTSALDPELIGEVLKVMEDLAHEGATMIVVTHELHFAREAADRVVFLQEGRIVEEGPPEKVLNNPDDERTRQFLRRFLADNREPAVPAEVPAD
jgi:spermidine/putrescine transport system ATP-binding protein